MSEMEIPADADLSFEAHPSSTTLAHIEQLGEIIKNYCIKRS
jgi:hypothetical protein